MLVVPNIVWEAHFQTLIGSICREKFAKRIVGFIRKPNYHWSFDYLLANLFPSYKASTNHEASSFSRSFAISGYRNHIYFDITQYQVTNYIKTEATVLWSYNDRHPLHPPQRLKQLYSQIMRNPRVTKGGAVMSKGLAPSDMSGSCTVPVVSPAAIFATGKSRTVSVNIGLVTGRAYQHTNWTLGVDITSDMCKNAWCHVHAS